MTRNSGGIYSLPGSDFVTGTVISSNDVNTKFNDVATAMTDSLSRTGQGNMLAPLRVPDGSAAIPSMAWSSDIGTGFYLAATSSFRAVILASTVQEWTSTSVAINKALTLGSTLTVGAFATALGGSLTVTGTSTLTGAVTMGGGLTVDTSTLVVDATNNRVGIGTTAPNTTLAIGTAGVADVVVPVQISAGSGSFIYYSANKGNALGLAVGYVNNVAGDSRGAIRNVQNEPISVYVNNSTEVAEFSATGMTVKSTAPAATTAVKNTVTPINIIKAWALVLIPAGKGTGTFTDVVSAGFNIASVTISTTDITLNFAQAMASTAYVAFAAGESSGGSAIVYGVVTSRATGSVTISLRNSSGSPMDPSTVLTRSHIQVMGAQ